VISILATPARRTPPFPDVLSVWPDIDKKIKNAVTNRNKILGFIFTSGITGLIFKYFYQGLQKNEHLQI
jgi:hypothetical protein